MNHLFLLNAAILLAFGGYVYLEKRDSHSLRLLFFNIGLAVWNICVYLLEEFRFLVDVDLVTKTQLVASMVFVNGIFYFCSSYPVPHIKRNYALNLVFFVGIASAILFTDYITKAELVDGNVVFEDHPYGFTLYALYLVCLTALTLHSLFRSYRIYPEYRDRIRYIWYGLLIFSLTVLVFNALLPLIGIYDFLIIGRLSGIVPALMFSYAVTKYDFMDMTIIINRKVAWFLTLVLILISFSLSFSIHANMPLVSFLLMTSLGIFWAFYANKVQNFLLTSARRKFIRGWYDTEDVLSEISKLITIEKNRDAIFNTLESVLDDVFELEKFLSLVAHKNEDGSVLQYQQKLRNDRQVEKSVITSGPLIEAYVEEATPKFLEQCEERVIDYLAEFGFRKGRRCIVIPFYSPESLDGVIVLGERSNQELYLEKDINFFFRLVNFISAILYRLTPLDKLEKAYFENKQKLHEAEIQLIRAQKIESIVHATRQCHHEIRTPLNIIRLGIGRIKSVEDIESYKLVADEEISRAMEIVEETLTITDVSKGDSDRESAFDINEAIKRSARIVDESRFQLTMNLVNLPPFYGIFSDIQVVITNLLHNAMEAMSDGGQLTLSTSLSGDNIVIDVEDSGNGIPENIKSRVWEPYFSGNLTEVGNSTAGRGWGLTIVNRIVTEHKGTINFTSEIGVGTHFVISLPAGQQAKDTG